jgi:penicillin-binding protein 2
MAVKDLNKSRQWVIVGAFTLVAVLLLFRAAQLQLIDDSYRIKADAITIERDVLYPSRGMIYDRKGKLMVFNNALYDIMVTYKHIDPKMDTAKFCSLLGIDTATFRLNLEKNWRSGQFSKSVPFPFLMMISPEQFARFQESLAEFPGFQPQLRNVRGYPQSNAGHLLGYLNEVNDKHIKDSLDIYESGDYIGSTGLERRYEAFLRGKKGVQFILRDNIGRRVGQWKNGELDIKAQQGKDLVSGIDLKLQGLGEYLLAKKIGAVVAIEPKTGEILAMVTSPTFSPEQMIISKQRSAFISGLFRDSLKPMFDRSVTAEYPPGSIYKPVLAAIALQMGIWNKNNGVGCSGGYHYGNRVLGCHNHNYAGNLAEAVKHSCNAYFCSLYRTILDRQDYGNIHRSMDSLNAYLYRFGLGKPLQVDFPAERKGFIPTSKYYDKVYARETRWYSTYMISNGIGQGENQLTTLQMANIAATIANKGWFISPHIIRGYQDSTNGKAIPISPKYTIKNLTGVDSEHFDPIIAGMRQVIETGTGSNARIDGVAICGKTGTVQNPHGKDSSVFIGFAPQDNPQIAIAVYVENGGWGNDYAAPITGLMIEQFLKGDLSAARKKIAERVHNSYLAHSSKGGYYVARGSAN